MYKTTSVIFAFILTALLFTECSKSSPGSATAGGGGTRTYSCAGIPSPKFSADVMPIVTTVCWLNSSCHVSGSTNAGGPFTSYSEVFAKRVEIKSAILSGVMPKLGIITPAQVNAFICWIDSGAPNN